MPWHQGEGQWFSRSRSRPDLNTEWQNFIYAIIGRHSNGVRMYTVSQKNVPPMVCYNFDIRECILIFFGGNVTDKVSSQNTFTMPPQMTCASALPGKRGKHENRIFSVKCCISALPEFNQSLLDFFSLFDSRLIFTLLYDFLNLVINATSSGLLGGMVQQKRSRSRWTVLHAQCMFAQCMFASALSSRNLKKFTCDVFDSI